MLNPRCAHAGIGADQHEPHPHALHVEPRKHWQYGLQVGARRRGPDPPHGHDLILAMGAEGLAIRVDAARHHLHAAGVLACTGCQEGVAGDHEPRSTQARDTATRFLLGPREPAVDVGGRSEEQSVVEVVDIEPRRRIDPRKRAQQPQAVHQQEVVCWTPSSGCARCAGRECRSLARDRRT